MASLKNLEAALLTLQAEALKHFGAIEILINNPVATSEHTDYVDQIVKHAKALAEAEEAYGSLQKHFVPKAPPATHTEPRPTQQGEIVITPENSPTMKKAQKTAKARKRHESKKND